MNKNGIFTLEDLTEDFWRKVIYIERSKIDFSGMAPEGRILMFTETGEEYYLGCEGYDEFRPYITVPFLRPEKRRIDSKADRIIYCAEQEGWTYAEGFWSDVLIRDDYYPKIADILKKDKDLSVISAAVVKMFEIKTRSLIQFNVA